MNSTHQAVNLKQIFRLFMKMIASITTMAIASGALFLIGFHVIPVFADKAPQMFSEQDSNSQVLLSQQETKSVFLNQSDSIEKKTAR